MKNVSYSETFCVETIVSQKKMPEINFVVEAWIYCCIKFQNQKKKYFWKSAPLSKPSILNKQSLLVVIADLLSIFLLDQCWIISCISSNVLIQTISITIIHYLPQFSLYSDQSSTSARVWNL